MHVREGQSLLELSGGGRGKEAVFWQQPKSFREGNVTTNYQGETWNHSIILIGTLYRLHGEDREVPLHGVGLPGPRGGGEAGTRMGGGQQIFLFY